MARDRSTFLEQPATLGRDVRATVICNPVSGTHNVRSMLPGALDALQANGWQVELQVTAQAGDVGRIAARARDLGHQVVLVAGGDGSLNEAVNALAYSDVALGTLPSGTANVWARQIGLPIPTAFYPTQLVDAARMLSSGTIRRIDLGRAADRYFLLWSGVGLDAQVTATVEPRPVWVKRFGLVGYGLRAIGTALNFRGTRMTILVDDRRVKCRALMVLISNTQLYGAFVRAMPEAVLDDGLLDICIFKGNSFIWMMRHLVSLIAGRGSQNSQLILLRGRHVHITTRRTCHVHVDAEPIGHTPIDIEVAPKALRVLVPARVPASLFSA